MSTQPQAQTRSTSPSKINILPPLVAERIAAGEVIERPASVVKELVENSIDAGATEVEVRLQSGGCDLIEVTDNGSGMPKEDLEVCICRHATSKIQEFDDLTHLSTLGFRGEALPSIASVSDLHISSRIEGQATFEIKTAHSAPARAQANPAPNSGFLGRQHGTRIRVLSLFSQIPARLKFLKSPRAETSAVREILERLALTHPEVGFSLKSDDRSVLALPSETLSQRTERLLGNGNPFELLEARLDGAWGIQLIWLKGLSSPHTRSMYQIVNGRALRDRTLQSAILNPLRQSFLPGHFPSIVIKLNVPSEEIDVNVHPTKTEVRFLDAKKVYAICTAAVNQLLQSSVSFETQGDAQHHALESSSSASASFAFDRRYQNEGRGSYAPPSFEQHTLSPTDASPGNESAFSFDRTPFGQYRGTLFSTYFVFEQGEELLMVDQHAAHERIRYEKLKNSVLSGAVIPQQELMVPEVIKLNREDLMTLRPRLDLLPQLGFDAEAFSEDSVIFRTVPSAWGTNQVTSRLKNLLTRLQESPETYFNSENLTWDEVLFEKVAMEACRSSFKAGDYIDETLATDLTKKLLNCEHPGNCPHGRPTMIKIKESKIEEWFSRKI